MGKRIVTVGSLTLLALSSAGAGCGGRVDNTSAYDDVTTPPRAENPTAFVPSAAGPERVADGLGAPSALAMTTDSVVFTTRNTMIAGELVTAGALFVADKKVGPALMVAVDRQGASYDALATDGTAAYVATSDGRLVSVPVMGGETTIVATLGAPAAFVATAGAHLYFANDAGEVGRVAKAGGEPETLGVVAGVVRGIEADDVAVYVATGAAKESEAPAGITRIALDGTASKVTPTTGEPCAMIREGRRLFWTSLTPVAASGSGASGAVLKMSLDDGDVATVASGAFTACAIATDKTSLYFATTLPNAVPVRRGGAAGGLGLMRAPIAGGEPSAVAGAADALAQPGAVAVDDRHVYWLTGTSVLRLRK